MCVGRTIALVLSGSLLAAASVGACGAFGEAPAAPAAGADGGAGAVVDGAVPTTDAGGACGAALATDGLNCGACGHDCRGAPCENGMCAPTRLAQYPGGTAREMTVGAGRLMWTDADRSFVCDLPACAPPLSINSSSTPVRVAITPARLYWTRNASLEWVPIPVGGVVDPSTTINANGIGEIFATDAALFYVETDKVKVAGAGLSGDVVAGVPSPKIEHVTASGVTVFFSRADGAVFSVEWVPTQPQLFSATTEIIAPNAFGSVVAVAARTADSVYCATDRGIGRAAKSTKLIEPLVPNINVRRMVLDQAHLYVTTAQREIRRFDLDGGDPLTLARADSPESIAVDDMFVYYADKTGIWRVAK